MLNSRLALGRIAEDREIIARNDENSIIIVQIPRCVRSLPVACFSSLAEFRGCKAFHRREEHAVVITRCEPYHDIDKSIYDEEYPLAKAIEEADLPLQQERVSIVGEVREMDLDARRFELRHIENLRTNELRCVYPQVSDGGAAEWLNKHVEVSGTILHSGNGMFKLLAVDSVVILK